MELAGPVQVVLEMEPAAGTISGRISVSGAPATGVFGWVELIDQHERAVCGTATAQPAPLARRESQHV
jgi:hypothetical protein